MSKILSHEQLISATQDKKGVAEIATIDEIKEGISNDTFISPLLLNTTSIKDFYKLSTFRNDNIQRIRVFFYFTTGTGTVSWKNASIIL